MSEGFKHPEAVWLLKPSTVKPPTAPTATRTRGFRPLIPGISISLAVGALLLFGVTFYEVSTNNDWSSGAVGDCLSIELDENQNVLPGGEMVACDDPSANYGIIAMEGTCADHDLTIRASTDRTLCLERIFQPGQCSPLTAPVEDPETRVDLNIVVPCNTPSSERFPHMARIVSTSEQTFECPQGTFQWSRASDFACAIGEY